MNSAPCKAILAAGVGDASATWWDFSVDGNKIEVRKSARPKIEPIQLSGSASGRRTSAAPRNPRNKRNINQECGFRLGWKSSAEAVRGESNFEGRDRLGYSWGGVVAVFLIRSWADA